MANKVITQEGSEYNQASFIGGMNLLLDDTHLNPNQYRIGFNVRNRYDRLDLILSSAQDQNAPPGIKQEMVTFGNYEILFVSGRAYYKLYTNVEWTLIAGFNMSNTAPRYWTKAIPVATTNYLRLAASSTIQATLPSANAPINLNNIAGAAAGNLPGLLVQDNINQPQFIFINNAGIPTSRVTQTFDQWHITFTDGNNTVVAPNGDQREYVPIGNVMEFVDGILYIASKDGNSIYRSVSGRPLDFVVNVTNLLVNAPYIQVGGGDATTTAYSVGVGGITCLRSMADGSLFVAASNSNFSVSKNTTPNAPTMFGEYTFIRKFLFNANCLSDRVIFDSIGDTRFIDLTGVRSFNSISQTQNEGRNTPFTATIQSAFVKGKGVNFSLTLTQDPNNAAAILFNDYELYAVNTIFGPAIAIYDTINNCWSSFDVNQTNGVLIKQLVKIELAVQALYAVGVDDNIYQLYIGPTTDPATVRGIGICSNILYLNNNIKMPNPRMEIKLNNFRVILSNITANGTCSVTPYVDNRLTKDGTITKNIVFKPSQYPTIGVLALSDVDTQLQNMLFATPNCQQGWKVFAVLSWTTGSITQMSSEMNDLSPQNPLASQSVPT